MTSSLDEAQGAQVEAFVREHCVERAHNRADYLGLCVERLRFIAWDLIGIGLVVDPADERPLLVSDDDAVALSSVETVSSLSRLDFCVGYLSLSGPASETSGVQQLNRNGSNGSNPGRNRPGKA